MRTEEVIFFTEKEEEFADLLMKIGTQKNVAKVLVFLADIPESTSRAIERGTDLRQPEVCVAMKYLVGLSWVKTRETKSETKGRPLKIYSLAKPLHEIIDSIAIEKKRETNAQLARVKKLRTYISS